MPRRPTVRQADIERALKAAQAVGLVVGGYEIDSNGRIVVFTADGNAQEPLPVGDDLDRELAEFEARHGEG